MNLIFFFRFWTDERLVGMMRFSPLTSCSCSSWDAKLLFTLLFCVWHHPLISTRRLFRMIMTDNFLPFSADMYMYMIARIFFASPNFWTFVGFSSGILQGEWYTSVWLNWQLAAAPFFLWSLHQGWDGMPLTYHYFSIQMTCNVAASVVHHQTPSHCVMNRKRLFSSSLFSIIIAVMTILSLVNWWWVAMGFPPLFLWVNPIPTAIYGPFLSSFPLHVSFVCNSFPSSFSLSCLENGSLIHSTCFITRDIVYLDMTLSLFMSMYVNESPPFECIQTFSLNMMRCHSRRSGGFVLAFYFSRWPEASSTVMSLDVVLFPFALWYFFHHLESGVVIRIPVTI